VSEAPPRDSKQRAACSWSVIDRKLAIVGQGGSGVKEALFMTTYTDFRKFLDMSVRSI
jgi:hypothetical protein